MKEELKREKVREITEIGKILKLLVHPNLIHYYEVYIYIYIN